MSQKLNYEEILTIASALKFTETKSKGLNLSSLINKIASIADEMRENDNGESRVILETSK